jgi:hypothetical protein
VQNSSGVKKFIPEAGRESEAEKHEGFHMAIIKTNGAAIIALAQPSLRPN